MNNLETIKIKIIIGSTRQNRFSEKPAKWIFEEIKKLKDVEAELLDLRDYPMPFFNEAISPLMLQRQYSNKVVKKWSEKINEGDAFIIVTPEYNHGYPAVLKNAMDAIYPEWNRKPVGFISYGGALGTRAVEQLRQVAIELQMVPIRNSIHIPVDIFFAAIMGKGPQGSEVFESIRKGPMGDSVERFLNELLWWGRVLKTARAESVEHIT
ncbi:MAG: NAD(P)H-dependent oxidoreductase [Candidatus Pacearchaeota archaeon]